MRPAAGTTVRGPETTRADPRLMRDPSRSAALPALALGQASDPAQETLPEPARQASPSCLPVHGSVLLFHASAALASASRLSVAVRSAAKAGPRAPQPRQRMKHRAAAAPVTSSTSLPAPPQCGHPSRRPSGASSGRPRSSSSCQAGNLRASMSPSSPSSVLLKDGAGRGRWQSASGKAHACARSRGDEAQP